MKASRLLILSVIYNFKEFMHNQGLSTEATLEDFPYIRVTTKDQAYTQWSVPCIVIYLSSGYDKELQIGGGYWLHKMVNFDVYGATESQLLDLVDYVTEFVEHNGYLARYDEVTPTYQVSDGNIRTVYTTTVPETVCQMYFENRTITFMDRVDTIGEARAHAAQVRTIASIPNY